jgi:hypothetical protein
VIGVLVTVALATFSGWQLWRGLSTGVVMGHGSPVRRAASPIYFWMVFATYAFIFAVLGTAGALELIHIALNTN